jgi:hypothetical protein
MKILEKLVVVGLVAAISLAGTMAPAQKGGGGSTTPPPAPGKIYYSSSANGTSHQYSMNSDGTAKTLLFSTAWPYIQGSWTGHPSYGTPGGKRWFVSGRDHSTASEWAQFIVFTSDSGDERAFQLEPTVPQYGYNGYTGPAWVFAAPRWIPGDSEISAFSTYYDEDGYVDQLAVHTFSVIYDQGGNPAGIGPKQLRFDRPAAYYTRDYDWNPAGTAIVFVDSSGSRLTILDAAGDRHLYTGDGSGLRSPAWAPGTKNQIAFSQHSDLRVINVDGTGVKVIATVSGKNGMHAIHFIDRIGWSMNGADLVFDERSIVRKNFSSPWQYTYQIMRVPSAGGTKVKIGDGLNMGWR